MIAPGLLVPAIIGSFIIQFLIVRAAIGMITFPLAMLQPGSVFSNTDLNTPAAKVLPGELLILC